MSPETIARDARAKSEAMRNYAAAYDRWAEFEQRLTAERKAVEAEGAHQHARYALRAWIAEKDNPEPPKEVPA